MNVRISVVLFTTMFSCWGFAQNEALITCKGKERQYENLQDYIISLTEVGDIVVENESSKKIVLYLPIVHAQQLKQNDAHGLSLIGTKKRMGMILKEQKIIVNYASGKGSATENSILKNDVNLLLNFQDCKKL